MKIGDLFMGLIPETAEFKKAVTKAAQEAGDAGGKTMASRMGAALKGASLVIGAGLAFATKGAMEAEAAQGKFMAATGKSREEAKKFVSQMDTLAGTSGAVGRTFEEIAQVGTNVEQQFKVTGEEARNLTGDILEFSKVTGQDAAGAALQLEDTLSAFGLEASDAAGFMDMLVASNQKFGTDAGPETLSILQKMAPALQAMGMEAGDGVELLNALEVAGVDAASAAKGLQTAVGNLKPGQTIDDLIAQIAAIEDPILKNQAAVDLFGTKAGPGLAKLIKPGMTSLDAFGLTAEEAAGSVDRASEDMLTFTDRIKGFADKALAGAREVGQQFGPLLTGLGSLGTLAAPFAKGLKGLFGKLLGDLGLKTAAGAVGAAEGEAQVAGATGASMLSKFLAKFGLMTGAKVAAATAAGTLEGAAEGEAAATAATAPGILSKLKNAGGLGGAALKGGMVLALAALAAELDKPLSDAGHQAGRSFFGAFGDESKGLAHGTLFDTIGDSLHDLWFSIGQADPLASEANKAYNRIVHSAAEKGIDSAPLVAAFDKLVAEGMDPKTAEATVWASAGQLGDTFTEGLADHINAERGDNVATTFAGGLTSSGSWADTGTQAAVTWNSAFAAQYEEGYKDLGARHLIERYLAGKQDALLEPFRDIGRGIVSATTEGMWGNRDLLDRTAADLRDIIKNGFTPEEGEQQAIGQKWIKLLAKGMESENVGSIEKTRTLAGQLINTIEDASGGTPSSRGLKAIGQYFVTLLDSGLTGPQSVAVLEGAGVEADGSIITGLKQKYPIFFTTGVTIADRVTSGIDDGEWQRAGYDVAGQWITGFKNKFQAYSWANLINSTISPYTRGQSPPPKGPLHDIGKWGFNVGAEYVKGIGEGMSTSNMLTALPALAPLAGGGFDGEMRTVHDVNLHVDRDSAQAFHDAGYDEGALARELGGIIDTAFANRSLRWSPGG